MVSKIAFKNKQYTVHIFLKYTFIKEKWKLHKPIPSKNMYIIIEKKTNLVLPKDFLAIKYTKKD